MQRIRLNGIKDIIFWIVLPVVIVAVLVVLDQLTKLWFSNLYFEKGNTMFIEGLLSFTYTVNTGSAFSFLAGKDWAQTFFKVITVLALITFVFVYLYAFSRKYKTLACGITLIFSGTVGNFIDRLFNNGVIDFIKFEFIKFPIFNLADILLTFGVIVFMVHFFFLDENAIFPIKSKKQADTEGNDGN